jgi:hypothetical protein
VIVGLIAGALLVACILRVALIVRPLPGAKLPDPSKVAGMPMAGPASVGAAHAALSRKGAGARPKFRT